MFSIMKVKSRKSMGRSKLLRLKVVCCYAVRLDGLMMIQNTKTRLAAGSGRTLGAQSKSIGVVRLCPRKSGGTL